MKALLPVSSGLLFPFGSVVIADFNQLLSDHTASSFPPGSLK